MYDECVLYLVLDCILCAISSRHKIPELYIYSVHSLYVHSLSCGPHAMNTDWLYCNTLSSTN